MRTITQTIKIHFKECYFKFFFLFFNLPRFTQKGKKWGKKSQKENIRKKPKNKKKRKEKKKKPPPPPAARKEKEEEGGDKDI